ncbi:MAG: hypothetical protein ACJAVT_001546 [Yoonia sp.]
MGGLGGDNLEAAVAFGAHKHRRDVKFLIIFHDDMRAFFETSEFSNKRDPWSSKISVISFASTAPGAVIAAAASNAADVTFFNVVIITQKTFYKRTQGLADPCAHVAVNEISLNIFTACPKVQFAQPMLILDLSNVCFDCINFSVINLKLS